MNKRRRGRAATPPVTRLVVLIAIAVVLILLVIGIGRGLMRLLNLFRSDGGTLEPDPQFPRETRQEIEYPAELTESGASPIQGDDPSQNWVYEELTPVDKTAAELAAEN